MREVVYENGFAKEVKRNRVTVYPKNPIKELQTSIIIIVKLRVYYFCKIE
jgi:hypothetical protein